MLFAMKTIDPRRCALVLVDYQQKLMPAIHGGGDVLREAARLADAARAIGIRVIGTEQNPAGLGPNVDAIRGRCDLTLAKRHFDGCREALVDEIRRSGLKPIDVVIAGCEAHVCLMQTALGLLRAGFHTWVVGNASGSRSPMDHAAAMQRLRDSGAIVASVEMVVFEWLQTCDHERFREVLQLLKERA
jgi:nicotinamidase-related amidase